MTNQELKDAMLNRVPIIYNGMEYDCVSGIIYRNVGGKIAVTAELFDKSHNSVSIVSPQKISIVGGQS